MPINRERVGRERIPERISFAETGRTVQSEKDSTDINLIMARFEKGLVVDHVNERQGNYDDVRGAVDYHTALNIQQRAEEMFMTIPARIRRLFDNDPGVFLAAVDDPARRPELIQLGLFPAEPLPPATEPVPEPEPPAEPPA